MIGVIAITPLGFFGFLALGIWTLIVSVMLCDAGAGAAAGARRRPGRRPELG